MRFNTDLHRMSVVSRTFRVLVALTLLLSASAPLVRYACGVTGATTTTSTLVAETTATDAAPCGTVSEGVHNRLCEAPQSTPICDGDACTTDSVEKESVVHSQISSLWIISAPSFGALSSEEDASSHWFTFSRSGQDADWSARAPNSVPVRLRTRSFRL